MRLKRLDMKLVTSITFPDPLAGNEGEISHIFQWTTHNPQHYFAKVHWDLEDPVHSLKNSHVLFIAKCSFTHS